jgi:hypothetical protein
MQLDLMEWVGILFLVSVVLAMIYPFDDDDTPREEEKHDAHRGR